MSKKGIAKGKAEWARGAQILAKGIAKHDAAESAARRKKPNVRATTLEGRLAEAQAEQALAAAHLAHDEGVRAMMCTHGVGTIDR